jgi:RNA-directed DNA polymerase
MKPDWIRLVDLHSRVHRVAYRARPARRVYIPKADGRQRPLGIAVLEDKIVQQAVVTLMGSDPVAAHIKRWTR